jgi:ferric-dicitrate binding protein FerR (iron transport regulator)
MDANERRGRATREATQWWNRVGIQRPQEISREDRELFTQWLRESPLHVSELLRIAHVHDSLERFKLWGEVDSDATAGEEPNVIPFRDNVDESELAASTSAASEPGTESQQQSRARLWAIAACAALVAILTGWFALGLRGQVIETDLAERRQVMLDDGSVVQLEPETLLRVKFVEHERRVLLERGRALFKVAKDKQRPFLVSAEHTSVRAVGTEFGVETGKRGVIVTVAEGKVAVTRMQDGGSGQAPATPDNVLLTAGQQITLQTSGAVATIRSVDATRALAWSEGQLVFENETLARVISEFNRYNRTQLSISDEQLAQRRVSGVFEATDTETLLAFIRQSGAQVTITPTDRGIVIGSSRR